MDERELRQMLRRRAESIPATPTDEPKAIRRARRRLALNGVLAGLVGVAVVAGGIAGLRMIRALPTPADRPAPPSRTKLAYPLDGDIFVADQDGSNAVRIADGRPKSECGGNGEYWAEGPMWSPDGRYLAYRHQNCPMRNEEDPSGIVISDPEGNVVAEVPSADFGQNLSAWGIAWAPDSKRFAAWVTAHEIAGPDGPKLTKTGETLGVFGLDGTRHTLLSVRPFSEFFGVDPVWLPDGGSLLVNDVVVPTDGTTPYELRSDGIGWRAALVFSHDGSRVAYVHERYLPDGVHNTLFVAEADGSNPEAVFEGWVVGGQDSVAWSPSGDRIAFTSTKEGTNVDELRVVDLDTGTVTLLTDWPDMEAGSFVRLSAPDFSPEGDRILFGMLEDEGSVWRVNVDGSDLRRLLTGTLWGDWQSGPMP
jgi:WD40 repeat protein